MSIHEAPESMEVLLRTGDTVRAEMIVQLLEGEGMHVVASGLSHRSLLGVVGTFVEVAILVPRSDLGRARELVEALEDQGEATVPSVGDDDAADQDLPSRSKAVAAFAAFIVPLGGAHMYVHQYGRAALFAAVQIGLVTVSAKTHLPAVGFAPIVMLADYLAAAYECDRRAGRTDPSKLDVRRYALACAVAFIGLGLFVAERVGVEHLPTERDRRICTMLSSCEMVDHRECLGVAAFVETSRTNFWDACEQCLTLETDCEGRVERCQSYCTGR